MSWSTRRRHRVTLWIIVAIPLILIHAPAQADQINIMFTAEAWFVTDVICQCLTFDAGAPMVGYYLYDSSTPDGNPNPNVGVYSYSTSPYGFTAYVGLHEFQSDPNTPDFSIVLADSFVAEGELYDSYAVWEHNPIDVARHVPTLFIWLNLRDDTETAISSDSLPAVAPSLDEWPTLRQVWIMGDGFEIYAEILFISEGTPTGIKTDHETTWGRIKSIYQR